MTAAGWKTERPGGAPFAVRNVCFDTDPVVFHHPGRTGRRNPNRIEGLLELKKDVFAAMGGRGRFRDRKERFWLPAPEPAAIDHELAERLTVIFPSNLADPGSGPRSLAYFGGPSRIAGRDLHPWTNRQGLAAIDAMLPDVTTEFLAIFDSGDVFFTDSLRVALDRFRSDFDCELLIGAAQNFWPRQLDRTPEVRAFCERTPTGGGREHRYVNSGMLIGRTDFYRGFSRELLAMESATPNDDQSLFYHGYVKHHPAVQLDHRCAIFQCEFDEEIAWRAPPRLPGLRGLAQRVGWLRRKRGR